jgi:glycosyltransferase involved in cell wall biosynthesis
MQIALFMTYSNSLESWAAAGLLERELAIYQRYARLGIHVSIVSFGSAKESEYASQYPEIKILFNKWRLPTWLYSFLIPMLFRKVLRNVDIFKSNQMFGAHIPAWCKIWFRGKFVVRQGYDFVDHSSAEAKYKRVWRAFARIYEKLLFRYADAAIFTTEQMRVDAKDRGVRIPRTSAIVGNYVVSEVWTPRYTVRGKSNSFRVACVGRFAPQKNLANLIRAARAVAVELWLIGDDESYLRQLDLEKDWESTCKVYERLPQAKLVQLLRKCDCLVLCSHYEGHPKILLEAMTFGMPVLVTDSPGIAGIVRAGVNGLTMGSTVSDLETGLRMMVEFSCEERARLGNNARERSSNFFSLDAVIQEEKRFFEQITRD